MTCVYICMYVCMYVYIYVVIRIYLFIYVCTVQMIQIYTSQNVWFYQVNLAQRIQSHGVLLQGHHLVFGLMFLLLQHLTPMSWKTKA